MRDQSELLDQNLYKVITKCFINHKRPDSAEVFVIYADESRERIWTFNPMRYDFGHREFIGKTKLKALFHCDRREPKSVQIR